jgi:hypothetical protein
MVLTQGQVALALAQVTAHQTPVDIFAAAILDQHLLAIGNARCVVGLIEIVLAQSVQNIQARMFQILTMDNRPIFIAILSQEFPLIQIFSLLIGLDRLV